jgi:hypothetical protein
MATARQQLIDAAQALTDRGITEFTPAQVIAEARERGCTNPDATLRTQMSTFLRADQGKVGSKLGFIKIDRGRYRLGYADGAAVAPASASSATTHVRAIPESSANEDWFWEGNVQAAVVKLLAGDGWRVLRVAGTESREHGVDVEARRGSEHLLVEVKGHPSLVYRTGERAGQPKGPAVGAQARTYFGGALLAGLLMRADHPAARVVLAFPDMGAFPSLARRVAGSLLPSGVEIWLVDEAGTVTGVPGLS